MIFYKTMHDTFIYIINIKHFINFGDMINNNYFGIIKVKITSDYFRDHAKLKIMMQVQNKY